VNELLIIFGSRESGVALRFPPQSKTSRNLADGVLNQAAVLIEPHQTGFARRDAARTRRRGRLRHCFAVQQREHCKKIFAALFLCYFGLDFRCEFNAQPGHGNR